MGLSLFLLFSQPVHSFSIDANYRDKGNRIASPLSMQNNNGNFALDTTTPSASIVPIKNNYNQENNNDNKNAASLIISTYRAVRNSVIDIKPHLLATFNHIFTSIPIQANAFDSEGGSGWVFDKAGHIVTDAHVVSGVNSTYDITFPDGNTYTANAVGIDPFSDLAVLDIIQDFSAEKVVPIPIANSSQLQVGESVMAIGNPFGLEDTLTVGVISNTERLNVNPMTGFLNMDIQTDAAMYPGDSGGPLLNLRGELVGVNHGGFMQPSQGIMTRLDFAIPSNIIAKVIPWLIDHGGKYPHPFLGFVGSSHVLSSIGLQDDLSTNTTAAANIKGVIITRLVKDGPADRAGLAGVTIDQYGNIAPGNIITQIDGHPITKLEDLVFYIQEHKSAYMQSLQGNVALSENVVTLDLYNINGAGATMTKRVQVVLDSETESVASSCPICI